MSEQMKIEMPENSNLQFSTIDVDDLKEDEYTDAIIAEDVSPSTYSCRKELCEVRKIVMKGCKLSPRGDKVMIRSTSFGSKVQEIHGFKPVNDIDEETFKESLNIGGSTCLYDAIYDGVASVGRHAEILDKVDIGSNAIIFILTDGMENSSSVGPQTILDKLEEIRMKEILESIKIIIIGFNDPSNPYSAEIDKHLNDVTNMLGLDQYINAGTLTPKQAAYIGGWVSQSISSQSQHLGTGGPSQNLTF